MTDRSASPEGWRSRRHLLEGGRRRVHLIGIGGVGMSAIAVALVGLGHTVTGSDARDSAILAGLASLGVDTVVGHDPGLAVTADLVAVSTAIAADDPEVEAARRGGVPVLHRFDLLAALGEVRPTLSVSGTHGKTTTSALVALVLSAAGRDPSYIIGAAVPGLLADTPGSARTGERDRTSCSKPTRATRPSWRRVGEPPWSPTSRPTIWITTVRWTR
ncbi:MAG: Mur ligase domain-containing protein [Microthrixaceae bacterium]